MVTFSTPTSASWAASSLTAPVVASTSQTLLTRRRSRGVRTHTLPNALATSMAATRSITNSCSASGISSGVNGSCFRFNPLAFQSSRHALAAGCPGASVKGTEILTGVLEATVRDPSRSGPGAQAQMRANWSQGNVGVGGQPNPIFTPARRPGNGTGGSNQDARES
jgi:hypothetical protein